MVCNALRHNAFYDGAGDGAQAEHEAHCDARGRWFNYCFCVLLVFLCIVLCAYFCFLCTQFAIIRMPTGEQIKTVENDWNTYFDKKTVAVRLKAKAVKNLVMSTGFWERPVRA